MVTPAPRATCYQCFRPVTLCLCAHIRPVANQTRVTVLQHPRERFHPFGTARFVRLALENAATVVAYGGVCLPMSLAPHTGLLYPHPQARALETLPAGERPRGLVVIDGTWAHAHTLYRDSPWLAALPHYQLHAAPSRYRIRRQPDPFCLATIEAVFAALAILEPATEGVSRLLDAFDQMVETQLVYAASGSRLPRRRHRQGERPDRVAPELEPVPCENPADDPANSIESSQGLGSPAERTAA